MTTYDFTALNDKEFERLTCRLLSAELGARIERFKPGPDQGVDGRFFTSDDEEIFLQAKHWVHSSISSLTSHIKTKEKHKVDRLKPGRYLLVTSLPLSHHNKRRLKDILSPWLHRDDDIYGQEDLNDLLSTHKQIEREFFKLWIPSVNVLFSVLNNSIEGRSREELAAATDLNRVYHPTHHHSSVQAHLDENHIAIITGEPGAGKTMLSKQIALEHVASGYEFLFSSGEVAEIESAIIPDKKQFILYDDFLGRNFLVALEKNQDSAIVALLERVRRSNNLRIVLTSRTTILNRGKKLGDQFEIHSIDRHEHEIEVTAFSRIEKAHILYNHIWHSLLDIEFIDEIYDSNRYLAIIDHQNFNPRLISFLFDRLKIPPGMPPSSYWKYVQERLENPEDIWRKFIDDQISDLERVALLITTFYRSGIEEECLYDTLSSLATSSRYNKLSPFLSSRMMMVRSLESICGSLLSRIRYNDGKIRYDLFTPSIGDYILRNYFVDRDLVKELAVAAWSDQSVITIKDLVRSELLTECDGHNILLELLDRAYNESVAIAPNEGAQNLKLGLLINLAYENLDNASKPKLLSFIDDALVMDLSNLALYRLSKLVLAAINTGVNISPKSVVQFVEHYLDNAEDEADFDSINDVISLFDLSYADFEDLWKERAQAVIASELEESDALQDFFSEIGLTLGLDEDGIVIFPDGYQDLVIERLKEYVIQLGSDFGVMLDSDEIRSLVEGVDIEGRADSFLVPSEPDDDWRMYSENNTNSNSDSGIHELFERS